MLCVSLNAQTTQISGDVFQVYTGTGINNVPVDAFSPTATLSTLGTSTVAGTFNVTILEAFASGFYTIRPTKLGNRASYINGVSAFDVVAINRHINGFLPITNPFKLMCADVNGDELITTFDAVTTRNLVLAITNNFGLDITNAQRPSWLFWNDNAINYSSLSSLRTNVANGVGSTGFNVFASTAPVLQQLYIVGDKLGDVAGVGLNPSLALIGSNNPILQAVATSEVRALNTFNESISKGDDVILDVQLDNPTQCIAWQLGLKLASDKWQIERVEGIDKNLYNANIEGVFNALNELGGKTFDNPNCFKLFLKAKCDISDANEAISLENETMSSEAYDERGALMEKPFLINTTVLRNSTKIFPSPFVNNLNVKLPSNVKSANVSISDALGRNYYSNSISEGNTSIDGLEYLEKGIYFVNIIFDNGKKEQRKVVKQ